MREGDNATPAYDRGGFRDELNFAEFPLSAVSDSIHGGQTTLEFTSEIFDRGRGDFVTRRLTVSACEKYGLPTALDDEVILGLIQLSHAANFADRKVYFTRYELIKLLGWRLESQTYERVSRSLNRWLGVTLYYDKAWWSKDEQCWVDEKFHILENVTIYDRERRQTKRVQNPDDPHAGQSSFTWNEVVFNSFTSGWLKRLDFGLYKKLKSAIAKRMFRFLDKRFYHKKSLTFDLRQFACEHIGLSRKYHNGEIKRRLLPAIRELEEVAFVAAVTPSQRFKRKGRGNWEITFTSATAMNSNSKELQSAAAGPGVVEDLQSRGVSHDVAADLAASFPDRIPSKIAVFDWLRTRSDKRVSKSPAGFLVASIRKDFAPPPDFPGVDRRTAAPRPPAPAPAIKRPAPTAQPETSIQEEPDPFQRYWESLSDNERRELEAQAVASASGFLLTQYHELKGRGGILFETVRQSILRAEVKRRLGAPAPSASGSRPEPTPGDTPSTRLSETNPPYSLIHE